MLMLVRSGFVHYQNARATLALRSLNANGPKDPGGSSVTIKGLGFGSALELTAGDPSLQLALSSSARSGRALM